MHGSIHSELEATAHANAIHATREIANWLRSLDAIPKNPAALADAIEAEFISPDPTAHKDF